ncbi:DUF7577 domain-containing protein [Natronolimnobius baerhuensis]|uniref:DUF7577 domain-containing protein n=1 Tax=Natronolimnobius baerhuensis TaxID=253108 RepID=A0A202EAS3_9EURY|nr:hypothetical protein [Natronolimnobius baerhuensis]OVE85268.1 hypothetical protein B2G88_00085 [Natronolimnobius baerhuensis]
MELWGWLIGYVLLFACLHLGLYYVYVRRESDHGDATDQSQTPSLTDPNRMQSQTAPRADRYPPRPEEYGDRDEPDESAPDRSLEGETIRCPHCGATNAADPTYTYCWRCISMLRQ